MNNKLIEVMEENYLSVKEDRTGFTVIQEGIAIETFRSYQEALGLIKDLVGWGD